MAMVFTLPEFRNTPNISNTTVAGTSCRKTLYSLDTESLSLSSLPLLACICSMKRIREDAPTNVSQCDSFRIYLLLLPELKHYMRAFLDDHRDRLHLALTCHEEYAEWPYRLPTEWQAAIDSGYAYGGNIMRLPDELFIDSADMRRKVYDACIALIINADALRKWPRFLDKCTMRLWVSDL
jgi:hypothetical protein